MTRKEIETLLKGIKNGEKSVEEALEVLQNFPYTDLGYAKIDHHREIRTGYPEIVYCAGKTAEQVIGIFKLMSGRKTNVIGTRADQNMFDSVKEIISEAVYYPVARIISIPGEKIVCPDTKIAVITAGTSDMPVAEEAAVTAELLGNNVLSIYDEGDRKSTRLKSSNPSASRIQT